MVPYALLPKHLGPAWPVIPPGQGNSVTRLDDGADGATNRRALGRPTRTEWQSQPVLRDDASCDPVVKLRGCAKSGETGERHDIRYEILVLVRIYD